MSGEYPRELQYKLLLRQAHCLAKLRKMDLARQLAAQALQAATQEAVGTAKVTGHTFFILFSLNFEIQRHLCIYINNIAVTPSLK